MEERRDSDLVEEIYCNQFIQKLNEDRISELNDLIGPVKITQRYVHRGCRVKKTCSVLGVFYRMYFRKVLYNLKNLEAYSAMCDEFFTIFPIELLRDHWLEYYQSAENRSEGSVANDITITLLLNLYANENVSREITNHLKRNGFVAKDESKDIEWLLRLIYRSNSLKADDEMKSLLDVDLPAIQVAYTNILKKYLFFFKFCQRSYAHYRQRDDRGYYFRLVDGEELSKKYRYALLYRKYALYGGDISDLIEDIFSLSVFMREESYGAQEIPCTVSDVDYWVLKHLRRYAEENIGDENDIINPGSRIIDYIIEREQVARNDETSIVEYTTEKNQERAKQPLSYFLQRRDDGKQPTHVSYCGAQCLPGPEITDYISERQQLARNDATSIIEYTTGEKNQERGKQLLDSY